MIKTKRYIFILLAIVFCLALTSCSFVSYIRYGEEETQAPDFDEMLAQRLDRINTLSLLNIHHEDIAPEYKAALLDAKNELGECTTVEQLDEVYEKHVYAIVRLALESHFELDDYRTDEQDRMTEILNNYVDSICKAASGEEIASLFRDFEVEIYDVKTDTEYYTEELISLKNSLKSEFSDMPEYAEYANAEVERIDELIAEFESELEAATTKELANSIFEDYKELLLAIPTIKDIELIQKNEAIELWRDKFDAFAQKHSLSIREDINDTILQMLDIESARLVNLAGAEFIITHASQLGNSATADLRENAIMYLQNLVLEKDYREEQKTQFANTVQTATLTLNQTESITAATDIFNNAKATILALPTSDTLWAREDTEFFSKLTQLYGDNVIKAPEKMYEASSYEELAAIIDFYAFYQTSNTSFLRDTFRVKLLYAYKTAQWEINEVYWYCELIRSAVSITGYIESTSSGNYLVITLIPHALSTNTNASQGPINVDRYESLLDFKPSPNTEYTPRANDFNDFAYLTKYQKRIDGIWNTQQLWYALEHEYIPVVVEGSAAEKTLERAKAILRQIILEGMSDEEKIFAIFNYFSQNVVFDDGYEKYLYPENRDRFPDELTATLASFHIEGALFDNLAVCEGFAKAMLLMLRIEGIESYRIFVHGYSANRIDNLGHEGYGSHALVAIKMSDGKFYISDPYEAYQHNTRYQKLHQFLIPWYLHTTYVGSWSMIFTDFVYGDTMLPSIMDNIVYNGKSIFVKNEQELLNILNEFKSESQSDVSISVFAYDTRMTESVNVESKLTQMGLTYYKVTYKDLTEYIIYK